MRSDVASLGVGPCEVELEPRLPLGRKLRRVKTGGKIECLACVAEVDRGRGTTSPTGSAD